MKVRLDYVTNSSSSSFVLAYKELPAFDDVTLEKYPFLASYHKLINQVFFGETASDGPDNIVMHTENELEHYYVDNFCFENMGELAREEPDLYRNYQDALKYIQKGYSIIYKYIDYNDEFLKELLYELANDGTCIIIDSE